MTDVMIGGPDGVPIAGRLSELLLLVSEVG
jgi:hypothetical protein